MHKRMDKLVYLLKKGCSEDSFGKVSVCSRTMNVLIHLQVQFGL
ncbi:hypothetical protein [Salipaludibacillus sp. LMS25]|nr:hypothetical protein [Salipaludibacillus sp. LMS25]